MAMFDSEELLIVEGQHRQHGTPGVARQESDLPSRQTFYVIA